MADERTTTFKGDPLVLVGPELKAGDPGARFRADRQRPERGFPVPTSGTRIFSVVPSLETPVCDQQTRRFNEEAAGIGDVTIYTVSSDLPFAQSRWCGAAGVDKVTTPLRPQDGQIQ